MLKFDPQGVRPLPFDESPGFTPPAAFGPYRVLHQIGSGVLGPVFRTYDPQQDRLVAVKAFRLDVVPEVVAKLADALRRLPSTAVSHPAIVPVLDAGLEGMSAYLAMEYVTAETLDVALRHLAPAPLDRVLPILTELAGAIDAAWAAGVGHGSLHPRDVFVTGDNDVRITGFGVAPALEAVGIRIPPRRPYAAPERGTNESWDVRADVYSLGVLAHELLTKRRPGGANEQDGSLVTGTSPEARALIRKVLAAALADRPEHRFASAAAFANALTAIVKGEPLGPLPEGATASEEKPAPPKKAEPAPLLTISEMPEQPPPAPAASVEPAEPVAPPEPVRRPASPPAPPIVPAPVRTVTPASEPSSPVPVRDRLTPPVRPTPPPLRVSPPPVIVSTPASFPWVAVIAASVASAAVFGVGGYRLGLSRRSAPPATEAAIQAAPPPGTDVVVAPPPAIAPAPPVGATKLPEPAPTTAARDAGAAKPAANTAPPPSTRATATKPPQTNRGRVDVTTGSMVVETRPAGARVIIDGKAAGVTPVTLSDVRAGSHPLRIELLGYKTLVTSVVVKAGERSRVAVTLELAGVPGTWKPSSR